MSRRTGLPSASSACMKYSCYQWRPWSTDAQIDHHPVNGRQCSLVFFTSKEDAARVAEAEPTSEHCLPLFEAPVARSDTSP